MNIIGYSTFDIAKILELPKSALQQYVDRGIISPSISESTGRGKKNIFSINDIYHLKLLLLLQQYGFQQKAAAKVSGELMTDHWKNIDEAEWDYLFIVHTDKKPIIKEFYGLNFQTERDHALKDLGSISIILNLYDVKQEVDKLVKKQK